METSTIITILVGLLTTLLCCGVGIFFLLLVVGIIILRRRGKKVSMKSAVSTGAETVSQVFVRGSGGLEALGDDDDDD